MPPGLALDHLTRITNVQWGGTPRFVMGDFGCDCFLIKPPDQTTSLGTLAFLDSGAVYGSSYKDKMFLLCGYADTLDQLGTEGVIMASSDGETWSEAFRQHNIADEEFINSDASVLALVWDADADAFYGSAHLSNQYFDTSIDSEGHSRNYLKLQEEVDILLRSADGRTWSEAGRVATTTFRNDDPDGLGLGTSFPDPPKKGLLVDHCPSKLTDVNDNNVPDGVYYYQATDNDETLIYPQNPATVDYAFGRVQTMSDDPGSGIVIKITSGEITTSTNLSLGFAVQAVSGLGNTIVAVGGKFPSGGDETGPSHWAVSTDLGETWTQGSFDAHPPMLTVSGGSAGTTT